MNKKYSSLNGFTLIELLVVIAIIAVLSVVVILTLNPSQLLAQSRDATRLSDISTLSSAVGLYNIDQSGSSNYSIGSSGVIYISTPDPTATTTAGTNCAGLGLSGSYHCPASSTYESTNGTGWLPVNFSNLSAGIPFSRLPIDPLNNTSSNEYYQYQTNGITYELTANPESQKYTSQVQANTVQFISGSNSSLAGTYATSSGGSSITYTSSTLTGVTMAASAAFDSHTNTMWITDVAAGGVVKFNDTTYATTSYTTGSQPEAVAFDSHTNTVWVANASGNSVTQINDTTFTKTTYSVPSGGAKGVVFDPSTNSVWVMGTSTLLQFNDTTFATTTHPVASGLVDMAYDSHTNTIWLVSTVSGTAIQFNVTSYATSSYAVGATTPFDITFDSHTNTLWTANWDKGTVTQINDTTYATSSYGVALASPVSLVFDPHSNLIWVANNSGGTVTLVNDTTYATSSYSVGSYGGLTIHYLTPDTNTNAVWLAGISIFVFTPSH